MTMAAAIDRPTADAPVRSRPSRIAGVEIITDLDTAEQAWRSFEGHAPFATPYQRFDFLNPWQRRVGVSENARALIVVAYDGERRPLMLLPLTLRQKFGIRIASFMGGKHSTFNMPLWDAPFAREATASDVAMLVAGFRERCDADLLVLTQQPLRWQDQTNPFALLPRQPSVNACPVLPMAPGAQLLSNSFRRRLRGKERKLQALRGYRYFVASDDGEITALLDWFFRVKPLRMAEQKLPNVFAGAGVEDFIRDACMARLSGGNRVIDIHALSSDEEIIALFAGVADGHRFSMMFNTYTLSEHARYSPGLILMRNIIDHYAGRGYHALDLGIGSDDYKRLFCKDDEAIFDSFVPLSARGTAAAALMSAVARAKHRVKQSKTLFRLAQRLRGALHQGEAKEKEE
jgi:CelD/BcsL family acetyltransferase involved in cellulose biosynthesis